MKDLQNLLLEEETQSKFSNHPLQYSILSLWQQWNESSKCDECLCCRELLKGPLYYVLILILCALVFWRESPVGVISLAMMCGGDGNNSALNQSKIHWLICGNCNLFRTRCFVGVADIMGRRFGYQKIPYNQQKSWAGTISMFVVGFLTSIGWVLNLGNTSIHMDFK